MNHNWTANELISQDFTVLLTFSGNASSFYVDWVAAKVYYEAYVHFANYDPSTHSRNLILTLSPYLGVISLIVAATIIYTVHKKRRH